MCSQLTGEIWDQMALVNPPRLSQDTMKAGESHPTLRVATDRWRTATAGGVVGSSSIVAAIYACGRIHEQGLAMVALLAEDQLAGQSDEVAPSVARKVWRRACWAGTLPDYIWRKIAERR